ncbi:hypothetical protein ACHAWO_003224 [Cyclotella atomus]|uniref:Peptidase M11 gametolysin domain-containing protein n=1 Tax=Cyclotella atomus TaxID=382360 RepID=A0ABD3NMS4_9STRA
MMPSCSKVMDVHELSQNPCPTSIETGPNSLTKAIDSNCSEEEAPRSTFQRRKILIVALALCTIIAIAASVAPNREKTTTFELFDPTSWLPSLLDHLDLNPHGGDSPYDFALWNTGRGCNGLEISILDNLEDKWKPFLQTAVSDWDDGQPDALTINVREMSSYDSECSPVRNVLKVCNGDYGNTDWVGVNIAIVVQGFISSSVAKMNDYHLDSMTDGSKQWTMCHELGHGFGLGHWDERFYNRDLGNCMDYTSRTRKESNQKPDTSNFEFLQLMYGNVDGTSQYSPTSVANDTDSLHCSSDDMSVRRALISDFPSEEDFERYLKSIPSDHTMTNVSSTFQHPQSQLGWRYLRRSTSSLNRVVHEIEIEDDVNVIITYHLV